MDKFANRPEFAAEAVVRIKANMQATGKPVDMNDLEWRIQFAMIGINTLYDNLLISTDTRNWFYDEIGGALDGQTTEQRAATAKPSLDIDPPL
ncbi:unnamed protein product [Sphagnum balticum]